MQFLEQISKPVENLPSAEIQLERKEAEKAGQPNQIIWTSFLYNWNSSYVDNLLIPLLFLNGSFVAAGKESPIVTPLMVFIRQRRAAKNGPPVSVLIFYTLY